MHNITKAIEELTMQGILQLQTNPAPAAHADTVVIIVHNAPMGG